MIRNLPGGGRPLVHLGPARAEELVGMALRRLGTDNLLERRLQAALLLLLQELCSQEGRGSVSCSII